MGWLGVRGRNPIEEYGMLGRAVPRFRPPNSPRFCVHWPFGQPVLGRHVPLAQFPFELIVGW